MISINKPLEIPQKLIEYEQLLDNALQEYGKFDNIPEELRNIFSRGYRHDDVKNSLFNCSHHKCAYCETKPYGGYLEVEHFLPKSLYPELTLKWDNLLPSCEECNNNKSTHDTGLETIINPCQIDPEPYFNYEFLSIYPSDYAPNSELAERTIQVCNLNRPRLVKARMEILEALTNYERVIKDYIQVLNESNTERKTQIRLRKLIESIEVIEKHKEETEQYTGLCRTFLKKSIYFNQAKELVQDVQTI